MSVTAAPINPRLVGGLDNGITSGALVVLDRHARDHAGRERVVAAVSLVEPRGAKAQAEREAKAIAERFVGLHDKNFTSVMLRSAAWVQRFSQALDTVEAEHGPVEILAVEAFDDQAQHAKTMKKGRYKTPVVLGMLVEEFTRRGYRVDNGRLVYQNAGLALKQWETEIKLLADRVAKDLDKVRPGDRLITNEHQRSAFGHVLALSHRLNEASTTTTNPTDHLVAA